MSVEEKHELDEGDLDTMYQVSQLFQPVAIGWWAQPKITTARGGANHKMVAIGGWNLPQHFREQGYALKSNSSAFQEETFPDKMLLK